MTRIDESIEKCDINKTSDGTDSKDELKLLIIIIVIIYKSCLEFVGTYF